MENLKLYKANGTQINDFSVQQQHITVTCGKKKGSSATITAPTIENYQFVTWVEAYTQNWTASVYINEPWKTSTKIWVGASDDTSGNGSVGVTCIYRATLK